MSLPSPGELHLWFAPLAGSAAAVASSRPLLSADERTRADRFKFERDQHRFTLAHAALRQVLAPVVGIAPSALRFTAGPQGKPALHPDHCCDLQFNLSHSGDWALIGFTVAHPLGVDVEAHDRRVDADEIVDRFFAPNERHAYHALPEPDRRAAFFRAWTRKEAYVKARGDGLGYDSARYAVDFASDASAALLSDELTPSAPAQFKLHAVPAPTGYTAACACADPTARLASIEYLEL